MLSMGLLKMNTLTSIQHLNTSSHRLSDITDCTVASGGYGDIRVARLREPSGVSIKVAIKKLRPSGSQTQQLRVVVVGVTPTPIHAKCCIDKYIGIGSRSQSLVEIESPKHHAFGGVSSRCGAWRSLAVIPLGGVRLH